MRLLKTGSLLLAATAFLASCEKEEETNSFAESEFIDADGNRCNEFSEKINSKNDCVKSELRHIQVKC